MFMDIGREANLGPQLLDLETPHESSMFPPRPVDLVGEPIFRGYYLVFGGTAFATFSVQFCPRVTESFRYFPESPAYYP